MSKAVKVGIFVFVGITLFCMGLFLIGSSAQLFGNHFVVYARFNNIDSLASGAKVRVAGMDAGEVSAIKVPNTPSAEFRLKLSIDSKFHPIVRKDSLASIETQGFVGNQFINITKGTANSPECSHTCTLKGQQAVSMGQLMREGSKLAENLQGTVKQADATMKTFDSVAKHTDGLIVAIRPKIAQIAGNADAIVAGIRDGQGAAGKLLTDQTVGANVAATIANAKQASANFAQASQRINQITSNVQNTDLAEIHETLKNAQQMTGRLNQAVGTFLGSGNKNQNTMAALSQAVQQAQQAMANLAGDTEAIKTNFFFRGFFNRRGFYNLATITPVKYDNSRFVKDPRERVWIPASKLFTTASNGSQVLTKNGRSDLDNSMSKLVPYLPNNPIVIEGYSNSGMLDQQYLESRQRAIAVRTYLDQRFHLKPKRVGIMPLADRPPQKTGKDMWNGVCLVLVVSEPHHGLF